MVGHKTPPWPPLGGAATAAPSVGSLFPASGCSRYGPAMRTQTWTFAVQISSTGRTYYSVARSYYTERGRQLPDLLRIEDVAAADLPRVADAFADEVGQVLFADGAVQPPLPL